jgi:DNA-binding transcriptional MocR family regulator
MLTKFAQDAEAGGYAELHGLIARNRRALAEVLDGGPVTLTDPNARISVARVTLPEGGPNALALYEELVAHGTHVLPCGPFHWNRPADGVRQVRLALARTEEDVVRAARTLQDAVRAHL